MLNDKFIGFQHWNIKGRDYKEFMSHLPLEGTEMEQIGMATDDDYPIYGVKYGDTDGDNVLMIVTGIHAGPEWVICEAAREFLKALIHPERHPEQERHLRWINDYFDGVYWVPIASPWSFVHNSRDNKNGVDLNRDFNAENPQAETQVIKEVVHRIQPTVMIDGHETSARGAALAGIRNDNDIHAAYIHKVYLAIKIATVLLGDERAHYHGLLGGAAPGELRRWGATVPTNKQGGQIESTLIEIGNGYSGNNFKERRARRGINLLFASVLAFIPFVHTPYDVHQYDEKADAYTKTGRHEMRMK